MSWINEPDEDRDLIERGAGVFQALLLTAAAVLLGVAIGGVL